MILLEALIKTAASSVGRVYLFIDGPTGDAINAADDAMLRAGPAGCIHQSKRNLGIAAGLNTLCEAAIRDGFERIIMFDQDSEAVPDLICRLDATLSRLVAEGTRPAAVGARPIAAEGSGTKAPRYHARAAASGNAVPVDFVIISGCLLNLNYWSQIGAFDEVLRMDAVDVEWGFRAWSHNCSVWVEEVSLLSHRVGTGTIRLGPVAFPRQSVDRMANYVRSQALLLRQRHVPIRWKLRSMIYVPLQIGVFVLSASPALATARKLISAGRDGWIAGGRS